MKKIWITLVFLSLSLSLAWGQSPMMVKENSKERLVIQVETSDLEVTTVKTERGYFSQIKLKEAQSTTAVGNPELPLFIKMIEVPIGAQYQISTNIIEEITVPAASLGIEYSIYPAQPSYSKSHEGPIELQWNEKLYETNQFYQVAELAEIETKGIYRNTNLAQLSMAPITYNPVSNEISMVRKFEVIIEYINPNWAETERIKQLHATPLFAAQMASLLNNNSVFAPTDATAVPVRLTIIANPMFEGALDEFVAWKRRKGFMVDEMYTNNSAVGTTTSTIKAYLQSLYDNATAESPAPTFVLFVGDVAQLPTFAGTTGDHPTDLYYVTFSGNDNLPDAYYGRFSATTVAQLQPQIEKTLMYEQYTMRDPSYLGKAVLVAGVDGNWAPTHGNGQINYLIDNYINTENNYSNVYTHFYPASGQQAATIRSEINEGVSLANYTAHCLEAGWGDPEFEVQHISSMNNDQKYGFLIGNCCQSGNFDYGSCFGEELLRAANKGAMGYIGASNNSYWNEDYYWSIGLRSATTANPTYDPNNLGAFDRLYHTHNEDASEWITTAHAIAQLGNMAVESSSSTRKLYYWEIYHLFGDPSVMPYLSIPNAMEVQTSSSLPAGMNVVNVEAPAYAYVALTHNGELVAATYADEVGSATLNVDPLLVGEYELAVWGQKYQQYFQTITVVPTEGSYVTSTEVTIANNLPTTNNAYLETEILFANYGNEPADNCYAKLVSTSPYINIENDSIWLGAMAANLEDYTPETTFAFRTSNFVENGTVAPMKVLTISGNDTTEFPFNVTINAPVLEYENTTLAEQGGNNNDIIDAGETMLITIATKNTGANNTANLTARLHSYYSGATVNTSSVLVNAIASNASETATFEVTIGNNEEEGTVIPLHFQIYDGDYQVMETIYVPIGSSVETFETNNFSAFDWEFNNNPWVVSSTTSQGGEFSARSKQNLGNRQSSIMEVTCNIAIDGEISFARRVSSEPNYDFYRFYIDDVQMEEESGNRQWTTVSFPVTAGERTFTFEYEKDYSSSEGSDAVWVDDIVFPPMGTMVAEDIAHLKVLSHQLTSNGTHPTVIDPGMPIDVAFQIENGTEMAANNVIATLVSSNGLITVVQPEQTISTIAAGETTNVTYAINSEALQAAANSDEYKNLANFELILSYENGETVYPFTIDFGGKCLGIESFEAEQIAVTVYPNPANSNLTITADSEIETIAIFDMQGREINSVDVAAVREYNTSVSHLVAGVYFVKVTDIHHKSSVKKLIITK